jgi:cytochrome b6-f complex iron-sulfur subunit
VAASLGAGAGALLDFLYPRGVRGFGGPVPAGNVRDYPAGDAPMHDPVGQFYMVHLDEADTSERGGGGAGGLLALWRKCPHLGCTVPWNAGFAFDDERGWFRCPCHRSTYTKAGVRVFGPAPRSMDTMRIEIAEDGSITVHTDEIAAGGPDNPSRAVPPDRPTEAPAAI